MHWDSCGRSSPGVYSDYCACFVGSDGTVDHDHGWGISLSCGINSPERIGYTDAWIMYPTGSTDYHNSVWSDSDGTHSSGSDTKMSDAVIPYPISGCTPYIVGPMGQPGVYEYTIISGESLKDYSYGKIISPSTVYDINGACYITVTGYTADIGYSIPNSYGRSPDLGYDTGMWNINAGGNTDHYYGAGFGSCGIFYQKNRLSLSERPRPDQCALRSTEW